MGEYEKKRRDTMAENQAELASLGLLNIKRGSVLHVPASVFPDYQAPSCGYWTARAVSTPLGGIEDVGLKIQGEEVFTWPKAEALKWVVKEP